MLLLLPLLPRSHAQITTHLFRIERGSSHFMVVCLAFVSASERFVDKNNEEKKWTISSALQTCVRGIRPPQIFGNEALPCQFSHIHTTAIAWCRLNTIEFRTVAVVKYFDHKNVFVREEDMLNQSNKYCTYDSPQAHTPNIHTGNGLFRDWAEYRTADEEEPRSCSVRRLTDSRAHNYSVIIGDSTLCDTRSQFADFLSLRSNGNDLSWIWRLIESGYQ